MKVDEGEKIRKAKRREKERRYCRRYQADAMQMHLTMQKVELFTFFSAHPAVKIMTLGLSSREAAEYPIVLLLCESWGRSTEFLLLQRFHIWCEQVLPSSEFQRQRHTHTHTWFLILDESLSPLANPYGGGVWKSS